MQLVVITWPQSIRNEHATLKALFHEGLEVLHVRKPGWTREKLLDFLDPLLPEYANRLVLHSHYELALQLGLRGIHITEKQKAARHEARFPKLTISGSAHNINQLADLPEQWCYAFLSPVFASISKPGYTGSFKMETLQKANSKSTVPLYALGGITKATLPHAIKLGFRGAAVLGHLWQQPDLKSRLYNYLQLKSAVDEHTS